jgi:GGDEF domain-containing protein
VPALERTVDLLPHSLHLQTDRLTGMYLKNVVFSAQGRALIDTIVPGPKRFVLLDCQHAGAANNHGGGEQIDRYFASLSGIFQRAALEAGITHVPLRLGGDEFGLVIPDDERATRFLKRVLIEVERSRATHVGSGSDALGSFVVERDTMRMLRNLYRREAELRGHPLCPQGFREYLEGEFLSTERGAALSAEAFGEYLKERNLTDRLQETLDNPKTCAVGEALHAAYLQKFLAISLIGGMRSPAGRFSMASVHIGEGLRWEDYHLAEGVASKRIQSTKDKVFTLEIEPPVSIHGNFVVKSHESAACRAFEDRERMFGELRKALAREPLGSPKRAVDLFRLTMLAVSDPNLPGVVRGELARELPAEVVLGESLESPFHALIVNVQSFGVFNNSKSYVEADRMLATVMAAVGEEFPHLAIVRQGGGRLVFLGHHPPEVADLGRIAQRLHGVVREHFTADPIAYQRMLLEYGERIALASQWKNGEFVVPKVDFGSCAVSLAMVALKPGEPLNLGNM